MNRDTVHRGWLRVQSLFRRHDYSIPATVEEINEPSNKKTHLLSLVSVLSRRQSQSQCKSEANDNVTPLEQRSSADEIEDGDQSTSSKHSWIDGVYLCAKGSALLLLINLVFIATAAGLASKYPDQRGFASGSVIYEGSCVLTKRWSAALHLIINILSTCILGASNYCMQTLAAPSREDIDKFHAQRRWLDIGRTSLRNLLAMGRYRLTLWFILLITTTPFHLLYNSVLFEELATNTFGYIIAPHDISPSNVRNLTTPGLENCFEYPNYRAPSELDWDGFATLIAEERYERITTEECIGYLSKALPAGTKALVALATDISVNDDSSNAILSTDIMGGMNGVSVVGRFPSGDQISGNPIYAIQARLSVDGPDKSLVFQNNFTSKRACMDSGGEKSACAHASDISDLLDTKSLSSFTEVNEYISNQGILDVKAEERFRCRSDGSQSSSQDHTIDGCLAIPDEMHCKLIYSPPFYIVIILSSLGKTVAVFLAARLLRSQSAPLLTTGDAISSFISRPDPTTVGMCWLSRADVQRGAWKKKTSSRPEPSAARTDAAESLDNTHEVQFKQLPRPKFWMQAPSIHQLALTTIMCLGLLAAGACLLQQILNHTSRASTGTFLNLSALNEWWDNMERGIYTPLDIPSFQLPFLNSLLIANIPQLVLTFTYYCYNNVLTSMLAAAEYSTYGDSSKPLRVSRPEKDSEQKSTCWLSIPYHYAVPMLLFSTVLHWLISQSFYYISITPDPSEGLGTYSTRSLAYSPLAIFVAILVGALMIFILLCLCFRRFTSRVSLAGTCSAAISAACHPPRDEDLDTAALGQLKWGETVEPPVWAVGRLEGTGNKGHCSFTSMETTKPLATRLYA